MNIKPIKVLLHTAGKTDEEILKWGGAITAEDIPRMRAILEAWDGIEVIVDEPPINEQIQQYALIGWDEQDCEIDGRVKEVIYLMEQDPMFGTYVDERERFELDWSEKRYEPAGSIVFEPEVIEILEETPAQRLARLILKHPDLPVIPMVDWEVCAGPEGKWMGSVGNACITEYIWRPDDYEGEPCIMYRYEAHKLVDALAEDAENRINPGEEKEQEYEAARQQAWKKVNEMEWRKAIFVNIDLPEDLEE